MADTGHPPRLWCSGGCAQNVMAPGAAPRAIPRSNRAQARASARLPRPGLTGRGSGERLAPERRSALGKDFEAMAQVWQMLRSGALRVWGEIGRRT